MLYGKLIIPILSFFFCAHILFTYNYLGVIGGTLFPLIFIIILLCYTCSTTGGSILRGVVNVRIIASLSYLVSLVSTVYYSLHVGNDANLFNVFASFLVVLVFYFPIFLYHRFDSVGEKLLRTALVLNVAFFMLSFLSPSLLYDSFLISKSFGASVEDARPRGLTQEASHFSGFVLLIFACLSAVTSRTRELLIFFGLITLMVYFIGSKFALIALVIFVALQSSFGKSIKFAFLLLFAPMFLLIAVNAILFDIENFNSTSTRFNIAIDGILLVVSHPLGIGFTSWEYHFTSLDTQSVRFFDVNSEYVEIISTGRNLSTKSVWIDSLLYFGWSFILVLFLLVRKIWNNDRLNNRVAVLVTIFLVGSVTSGIYTFFVMLALIYLACYGGGNERSASRKI